MGLKRERGVEKVRLQREGRTGEGGTVEGGTGEKVGL